MYVYDTYYIILKIDIVINAKIWFSMNTDDFLVRMWGNSIK